MAGGSERRRYKRYEIELPGRIRPEEGPQCDCIVRDYCSGGMLVQQVFADAGTNEVSYLPGQQIDIKLMLLTGKGSRAVRVSGKLSWARGDHFGLSFAKSSDMVVKALKQHDRLARGDARQSSARPSVAGNIDISRLRDAAQAALPALLQQLLNMTREDLLERAEKVVSNTELQQIYGDINAIDKMRQEETLSETMLKAAFDPSSEPHADEPAPGELSLVDPDDFERWLEASRVATMLDSKFGSRLSKMVSRLGKSGKSEGNDPVVVPFEPKKLTGALKDVAKAFEFGALTRDALFDSAAKVFEDKLGGIYDEIDNALDAMGAPAAKAASGISRGTRGTPQPSKDAGQTDNVSRIAGKASQDGVAVDPALLQSLVAREVQHREGLGRELVSQVSNAPDMTESLADWLKQIEGPLARHAAADKNFFHNSNHPAREIVDGLGHLQMFRANPDLPSEDDPIRERVSQILAPVRRGETDEAVLRQVADALGDLTGEQSRLYQRNVERVVEASEGRDRVRRARQRVVAEIRRRYAGRRVPKLAPELLEVGWRAVLELDAINAADNDERFTMHMGLLDSVVGSLGGEAYESAPLEPDPSRLFECVEKELATVAFDPFRRNALENRLRHALLDPLSEAAELVEMPLDEDDVEVAAVDQRPDDISRRQWLLLLERCAEVHVGDRVHLVDDAGAEKGLRVAWIRSDGEVFVLVDYRGLRVKDIRLAELAVGLHRGRVRIESANGQPMSDRAVDAILVRMEERLANKPTYDSLTGLINRQQFHAAVEKALSMPDRVQDVGVLLWLDIDQFRLVNDVHGYETGDRLLEAIARLLEQVKGAKVLGHLGADRFALMLPDIGLADAGERAEAVCEMVRGMSFDWPGQTIGLSVSIGVVPLAAGNDDFNRLLQSADDTLAAAKTAGGDRGYLYREDDPEITQRKASVQWVVQVDEALERGHLQLRCQPIVPVRTDDGLAPHYEVLLGVRNGSAEPLPIAEFIDAAERYNRMRAVDRWVARTTMEWIAAHREHMPQLHGFAVNLSGHTASDPSFVDFVREQFQRTAIDPAWLSFEVTETAAVSNLSSSAGIIHELKSLGCKVALDDFGSGQASYSYLKQLPVDWLKIDGVFVRKIATNSEDFAVVKSINDIGHFLGKKTIAEYVADDDILAKIREIGVDFAQGFGISPPLLMQDLLQTRQIA
jgi:diguanylate cyclase (GGDEF)-like protein